MDYIVQTRGLTKTFHAGKGWSSLISNSSGGITAVDGVDLDIARGELFGLLGPNGAGKTTLVKMLSTLITPSAGSAWIAGLPLSRPLAIKETIGLATGDERSFFWRLTGRQNLEFFAVLSGIPAVQVPERIEEVLTHLNLMEVADRRFQTYSTGMRQRLVIARALLHRPQVLFLDEPTQGLDPIAAQSLRQWIRDDLVDKQGTTVFLTTHDLSEAERLCDRIAIMHRGQIRACGTMNELSEHAILQPRFHLRVAAPLQDVRAMLSTNFPASNLSAVRSRYGQGSYENAVDIQVSGEEPGTGELIDKLRAHAWPVLELQRDTKSLEEIFNLHVEQDGAQSRVVSASQIEINTTPISRDLKRMPSSFSPVRLFRLLKAFLRRDFLNEASYRIAFLLQFAGIFISVGVYYFIAELFGSAAAPFLEQYGGDYFTFVMIGIAFGGYFGVGLSSFASRLRQAQTTGTLEAMLVSPTGISTIIIGSSLWDYLVTTLRVLVYLILAGVLAGRSLVGPNYPGAMISLGLTVPAFASIGIISASIIMVIKRGDPITWSMNALSGLLGGVYYPVEILPAWLSWISRLLPITYALEAMRRTLLQGETIYAIRSELFALGAFTTLLFPLSLYIFRLAVQRARADGSLTHY